MNIEYVNSQNESINLSDFPYCIQEPESLLGHKWAYTALESYNGGGVITNFRQEIREKKFQISIWADDQEDFSTKMKRLLDAFDIDVIQKTAGKLYCNDTYLKCFIIESEPSEYEEDFYTTEQTFTIVAENPMWINEKTFVFMSTNHTDIGFEYPHDFPIEYHIPESGEGIVENGSLKGCEFRLTINGPVTNPAIYIGGHRYGVIASANAGEYIEIDSRAKTVKKVGTGETNLFNNRVKESDIFHPISAGVNAVTWENEISFEIGLYEERSCAAW